MREVVVLPFVPATTTAPRVSCAEILPRSFGSIRSATRPGAAVPPPLPSLRLAVETPRAALTASTSLGSGRSSDMRLVHDGTPFPMLQEKALQGLRSAFRQRAYSL